MDTVLLFRKRTPLTDDRLPWLRGSEEHPWTTRRNASGKLVAVLRIGCAPHGNAPMIAAVGKDLAQHTAYLMRLAGVGLPADDLVGFVQASTLRFRSDMLVRNPERERKGLPPRDYRYLLSLDDPFARLIESPAWDILAASNAPPAESI